MRTYLVDDLYEDDFAKIVKALDDIKLNGPLEGIYYLPLPEDLLDSEQKDHLAECGPYFMALETVKGVSESHIRLELLVRGRKKIRCSCITYATAAQRKHMIEYLDQFIEDLGISA
ncbi:hypothetical protein [Pseudodesulfovibrio sp.]|uniref:hypothetical protein n=1 Tax=unclassified Pseudodesulfovibrio TaxID=2661612 RepID=UPI003B0079E7